MKLNTILKIFLVQVFIFVFASCNDDDFLDKKPLDTLVTGNFYKTAEGIQLAANAIYAPLGEEGFNGKTIWMIGDGASDDAQPNGEDPDYIPIDEFSLSSDNPRNNDMWRIIYRMIALANIVIENVDGNSASEDILNRVTGEALTLRAYGYFVLVRIYSDIPLILDGMTPEELEAPSRTPAAAVFKQIISDLEKAIELLPARSEYSGNDIARVNKHAAMGILAKVYMTIAGDLTMFDTEENADNSSQIAAIADNTNCYSTALELCDNIINSGEYQILPNFGDLFTREGDNCAESIWQLQFIGCGERHGSGNMMNAFFAPWDSKITNAGDGWGTHSPHEDLIAAFYPHPDSLYNHHNGGNGVDTLLLPPADKRFVHTIMFPGVEYTNLPVGDEGIPYALPYNYGKSGFAVRKYVIGSGSDVCSLKAPNNVYLLRYADIFLLKAECLVELGRHAQAAAVLDPIRERAGLEMISSSLSQEEMRAAVRLERRRELAIEQQRWFDMLRWGIAVDKLQSLGINIVPERRLFPIPSNELILNKNLVQNKTY
ncbi:MAG: RagB/SusD family nutrient uptake outer membrane protein [Bacteroidales bacterium]|nr:RagB/SusD family nutrient uptake outer membrane protein [Bacteroidales bacterium]MBN2818573.1 RagB/SusD family nutrient uptake outer membrane protein [Bacteroidales bacterium]